MPQFLKKRLTLNQQLRPSGKAILREHGTTCYNMWMRWKEEFLEKKGISRQFQQAPTTETETQAKRAFLHIPLIQSSGHAPEKPV